MLELLELEQVSHLLYENFKEVLLEDEIIELSDSMNRVLSHDIIVTQDYPIFHRSCVDGYAVRASDILGCSDSLPSILQLVGNIKMGETSTISLQSGECVYVPTGAEIPKGADSMVMVEFTEDYGDGTIGICKSSAPGNHIIFAGDDAKAGEILIQQGTVIGIKEIGMLATIGISQVKVKKKIKVGVLSSGDEIIPVNRSLSPGEIYDANGPMVCVALQSNGCEVTFLGTVKDDYEELRNIIVHEISSYDMLVISGGTSVGVKDVTSKVIDELGEILFHGIAVKPGKPTLVGRINKKPFFGLPGNPVAAYYILNVIVIRLIKEIQNLLWEDPVMELELQEKVSSNHGRVEFIAVQVRDNKAIPLLGKSGLIMSLAKADGYIKIDRNVEGIPCGANVLVHRFY